MCQSTTNYPNQGVYLGSNQAEMTVCIRRKQEMKFKKLEWQKYTTITAALYNPKSYIQIMVVFLPRYKFTNILLLYHG